MKTIVKNKINWHQAIHDLGKEFARRAPESDREGTFVFHNYEALKGIRFFSALVPKELGGGGISFEEMCDLIRSIAHYCGSTALAVAMHQHLIAASVWKYKHKGMAAPLLKKVAEHQLVLISTGARDWLASNGSMIKTEGGYLLSAKKHFASQSITGDIAITSAPFQNENGNWEVLHFPVPMNSQGVDVLDDWDTMGMRATGSQTIVFKDVFIPEEKIGLVRPQAGFHMVWNIVLTHAMPLIMSAYVGLAERASILALEIGSTYKRNQNQMPYLIGKINNQLLSAQTQWKAMIIRNDNFNFKPNEQLTAEILSLKTNVSDATKLVVSEAMEALGGQSFYRKNELERIFRDVQAAEFHPLPKWEQFAFTGRRLLNAQKNKSSKN